MADSIAESERFGQAMARTMTTSATLVASLRSLSHTGTEIAAAWLDLPTRRQIVNLASRVNHIELVLDDLEMTAAEILKRLEDGNDG